MTPPAATRFTDGEWHRLHPMTPLLKGGIAFVAIIGVVIVNLRDVVINNFFGEDSGGEPLVLLAESGLGGLVALAVIVGLLIFIAGFYFSWRMHTFRITDEVVEVRSGILFRTNRKGRLDRIQGINIVRPFLARLVGAAKLEVNVAGQDANVQLEYLGSTAADDLRRDILRLASGTQPTETEAVRDAAGNLIEQRVTELLAPELDPAMAAPQSVVKMHLGRLIGSIVLSSSTVVLLLFVVGAIVTISLTGELFFLAGLFPAVIGFGSFYFQRFTRSLRYSIAGTPDGVRVGYGLLTTSNETLPPGRIHSVQVSQPLLWRPAGWWEIKVNRASSSSTKGAAGQANTTILPVGNIHDVMKVLGLVLPDLADDDMVQLLYRGLVSKGGDDGFTNSPKRAAILRWFSWRRNGFAVSPNAVLLRRGAIFRELVVVPCARLQSVAVHDGPLRRVIGVASVRVHTVAGPISPHLGAIDRADALRFFTETAEAAVRSSSTDRSHRWRSGEAPA
ncbi:MAG: PH domain-containing protein [Microbacteriaceae bacterium]